MVKSGGTQMFIGEYHHTIDNKGRIIIPSKFRDELGDNFIITRGIETCLFVYPVAFHLRMNSVYTPILCFRTLDYQ